MRGLIDEGRERKIKVFWEPIGRQIEILEGATLLSAARLAGVQITALCGGEGICGKCVVRLITGRLSPVSDVERRLLDADRLEAGYRLACIAVPIEDVRVYIPPEALTATQRLQTEGSEEEVVVDPRVRAVDVMLDAPQMEDLRSDSTRLIQALSKTETTQKEIDLAVLKELSEVLRVQQWAGRCVLDGNRVVAFLPARSDLLGLAVDLGTTKVAAYLVDLETGRTLAKKGAVNPQVAYGDDVVNRIAFCNRENSGRSVLQARVAETLNELVEELCLAADCSNRAIVDAVVVGNTAMQHLFAGLPVRQLGEAPYLPASSEAICAPAREFGLRLGSGTSVYLPPNIAGYVGSDHVAMLLFRDLWKESGPVLGVDIGTNTEVSLKVGDRLLTCSCASGPAFEGAHIEHGMRAIPGAIECVEIVDGKVYYQTVEGKPPIGICGSGILDAVAELRRVGILSGTGRMESHPNVVSDDRGGSFCLVPASEAGNGRAITISRKDVNEILLAKGAIRTGFEILLQEAGLRPEQVERCVIAGAFGTYIDVKNAVQIGMFPAFALERFQQVGNAAGAGARKLLSSRGCRRDAEIICSRAEYIELTVHPSFFDVYTSQLVL